jgi:hypothetical protein
MWGRAGSYALVQALGIIIIALVVLSATVRGQPHFVPRPTGPLPAMNVP